MKHIIYHINLTFEIFVGFFSFAYALKFLAVQNIYVKKKCIDAKKNGLVVCSQNLSWAIITLLIIFNGIVYCQQTTQFTQFTFNKYGLNPAAAGSKGYTGVEAICGIRKQWVGFDYSPASIFVSGDYSFKQKKNYKCWHNVGLYIGQDKAGIFNSDSYYGSYAIHFPLAQKYNLSLGVFVGTRRFAINKSTISISDPVYAATSASTFYAYPDVVPGFRIYSKKIFFDFSIHQLSINQQAQGYKQIGNKSSLVPQVYLSYGKKIFLPNGVVLLPAIHIQSSFMYLPSINLNVMAYYKKRIGVGVSIRNKDFLSGIVQIRILETVTAGFAYDYSINKINAIATNSVEFMLGFTPLLKAADIGSVDHGVSKCPAFDY